MTGTDVATLPELPNAAYAPQDTDASDIIIPALKMGEKNSKAEGVEWGELYLMHGDDDVTRLAPPVAIGELTEPVLFYVLAPVRISYSWNDKDTDEFYVRPPGHPDLERQIAEHGSKGKGKHIPRKGYNYLLGVPGWEDDAIKPVKLLLKGKSAVQGRFLETELRKASTSGPYQAVPFNIQAKRVSDNNYQYCVAVVTRAEVPAVDNAKNVDRIVRPLFQAAELLSASGKATETAEAVATEVTDAPPID